MQHPDPLYLCRHILLTHLPDGRKQCLFRRNPLNPTSAWDKPVPRLGEALIFDKFVAPIAHYLPALEATAHYPSDHRPFDIIPSDAHVLTLADPLREFNPRGSGGAGRLGNAEYQEKLRTMRDTLVCKMVHNYISKRPEDDPLKPREVAELAIEQVAPRIRLSPATIWKILHKREGFTTAPERKPRARPPEPALFKLSTAYEYLYKYKRLCDVVQIARSNDKTLGPFSIHHLAVQGAPGGYPTHCPASGVELDWGSDTSSMYAPKLALRSVLLGQPVGDASRDVVLVSKAAKRILEGTGAAETLARFMADKPEHLLTMRQWLEDNNAADTPITNLKNITNAMNRR